MSDYKNLMHVHFLAIKKIVELQTVIEQKDDLLKMKDDNIKDLKHLINRRRSGGAMGIDW